MSELLEPLATEAGQLEIVRAIRDIGSLENAVRAELAAALASTKAGEAVQSALEASEAENKAKDWATKTDGYVEQETITTQPEQEGDEPTVETINLYSAKYYAALALDIFNNMSFDSVPTENSNALLTSGVVYDALDLKADKSTTYTKTEVDTALSNVQGQLTFDNVPTANSDNPVKSSGIKTALDGKQDTLTFDSTPTANSTNPVTSGGIYTALQNVEGNIEVDDEITETSNNPVTSAAIYEALLNFTPSGGGGGAGNASGVQVAELYSNSDGWDSGTMVLSDSIKNYDFIEFYYIVSNDSDGIGRGSSILTPEEIETQTANNKFVHLVGHDNNYINFKYTNDTTLTYIRSRTVKILKVNGIKFSKNLTEQMYSNVLYENSSGVNSGTITLSDTYDSYDFLEFYYKPSNWGTYFTHCVSVNDIKFSPSILLYGHQDKVMSLVPDSTTQLRFGDVNGFVLYKIIGYKMAKGGYSGIVSDARMTVKSGTVTFSKSSGDKSETITFDSPMPDTNYMVALSRSVGGSYWNHIDYGVTQKTVNGFNIIAYSDTSQYTNNPQVDWIAIRPNSYTREGMVEDVLFSNASGVSSGTINLSGNISDYDLICFISKYNNNGNHESRIIPSNILPSLNENSGNGNTFVNSGYSNYYNKIYYVNDNTLGFTSDQNVMTIIKITGIKFGRYVSGVAVDTTVTLNSNAVITSGAVYDALQNIPSGGGGGGSITIDSVPTENSQNAVSSGGVYDALLNLPSGGGSVDVYDLKTPVINGYNIKSANSAYYVAEKGKLVCPTNVYTHTDIPSLYAVFRSDNNGMRPILICPIQEGATVSRRSDGSGIDSNNNTYKQYYDQDREITWYCVTDVNMLYGWNEVLDSAIANNIPLLEDCRDWLSACKKLIQLAEPVIETRTVKENLFSPTNFTLSSGDTISSDILKALIAYPRPIVVNNETYYFVKKENGTSYYENPNNTIEVSSSWVITITAKSLSSGSSITVDNAIIYNSQNPVSGLGLYDSLEELLTTDSVLINDNLYYCGTKDAVLFTRNGISAMKKDSSGAICGIFNRAGYWNFVTASLTEEGAEVYSSSGSFRSFAQGTYFDSDRDITWYYTVCQLWDGGYDSLNYPKINNGNDPNTGDMATIMPLFLNEVNPTIQSASFVKVDTTPTENSTNVITSGAVYTALQNAGGSSITVDSTITQGGANPVTGGAIYNAIKHGLNDFGDYVPSDAKVENSDEMLYTEKDRTYYKSNSGTAAGALVIINQYRYAILVSDVEDAVISYSSYDVNTKSTVENFTMNGKQYYYSQSPYPWGRNSLGTVTYLNIRDLSDLQFSTNLDVALYIISNVLTENKTLSDYRITDAYTKTEVDTALSSKQGTLTFDTTPTADSTNPVTSGGVYTALQNLPTGSGDVTTNTDQNITGTKTFVGSKKVAFKQSATNDKLGFTLFGNTGTERGYLEFNPTNTVDGVAGLMTLGNYATSAAGLTQVGFRRYSNISGASGAYNLLMPMVADARTPFSLTTTYQNFYLPLGFTYGTTTVKTAKSGVVDLSPLLASLEARIAALEGN